LNKLAWASGTFYFLVSCFWVTQFVRFNIALKKLHEGTGMTQQAKVARWLFCVMISGYVIPSIGRVFLQDQFL
jgi:hypothetical protein